MPRNMPSSVHLNEPHRMLELQYWTTRHASAFRNFNRWVHILELSTARDTRAGRRGRTSELPVVFGFGLECHVPSTFTQRIAEQRTYRDTLGEHTSRNLMVPAHPLFILFGHGHGVNVRANRPESPLTFWAFGSTFD